MKNARLFGSAALALLALSLLGTGCGQPAGNGSPDVDLLFPADASSPSADAAATPGDGAVSKVDASAADAAVGNLDAASQSEEDATVHAEDAAAAAPDAGVSSPDAAAAGPDASQPCNRQPKAADRARKMVVAHPFTDNAANNYKAKSFDVLDLSATGVVTEPSPRVTFTMGRASYGQMVFTPDGEIGVVAQEDGSLGVVKFDESGAVQVLQAAFKGSFYADRAVMDPSGERFYVLDKEVNTVGGGVYSVRIGCDGTLSEEGKLFSASMPGGLEFPPALPEKAFLASTRTLASSGLDSAHLLSWPATGKPTRLASVAAFPDPDAIFSDAAVMPDGKFALISDSAQGRVAVVAIQASALAAPQLLEPFTDPAQLVVSPFGNAAAVLCSMSDSLYPLAYDPTKASPFAIGTKINTVQPAGAVRLTRGALSDRVFISELRGIRQVQFKADGTMTDLGLSQFLADYDAIGGALGIQP